MFFASSMITSESHAGAFPCGIYVISSSSPPLDGSSGWHDSSQSSEHSKSSSNGLDSIPSSKDRSHCIDTVPS